jgi:hypothetical protein
MLGGRMKRSWSFLAAQLGLLLLATHQLWSVMGCLGGCYADIETIFGAKVAGLSLPDMRLNSWILAWVQRALTRDPTALFDANAFHPASGGLTGSEHMLGVSIPLLPLAPFAPGAVLLHQLATVLSFLIMGWTTFALARWITRSDWAAFVAAAMAMFMPWRVFELAHVQLLSAHWIPLVWLLVGQIVTGDSKRWTPAWLAIVLFLQLCASYYLAYYVTVSLVVLVTVLALRHGFHADRAVRLGAALAFAYLTFVLLSLPYLEREAASDLVLMGAANLETSMGDVLAAFAGQSPGLAAGTTRLTYQVPLYILLLGALGALLGRLRRPADPEHGRLRSFSLALWCIVLTSMVFLLGNQIHVGERVIDLPGRFASEWIPGFRHLRTPARWSFLVGIAMPLLAGIGVQRGEAFLARLFRDRSSAALLGARIAVASFLLLDMSWRSIPVRSVGLAEMAGPYDALRELPQGPVLEIPWPRSRLREAETGSRYMLASTLHWNPILNGFAPYPPRSYAFLHRLGAGPPSEQGLEKLQRLSGLRWIVVHLQHVPAAERQEWARLVSAGVLRRAHADPSSWVLELVDREGAGAWLEALTTSEARERTLTGLARELVVVPPGAGILEVSLAGILPQGAVREVFVPVEATIRNGTSRAWPGFDVQTEGLVQLRYRFLASDGLTLAQGVLPLDADVPAQETLVTRGLLPPPERPGLYRARFDLVQRFGEQLVELDVPAFELQVRVQGPADGGSDRESGMRNS